MYAQRWGLLGSVHLEQGVPVVGDLRSWIPRSRVLVGWTLAVGVALAVSLAQAPAGVDNWNGLLWLSPGVAASALLLSARRHWVALMAAFWMISVLVLMWFGNTVGQALVGPLNNMVEELLIGWQLWPDRDWVEGRSDRLHSWLRFGLWGLLVAPVLGALIGVAIVVPLYLPAPVLAQTTLTWYVTDALALAVVMPLILRLRPRGLRQLRGGGLLRQALVLLGLVGMAVLIFTGDWFVSLFLVPLPLVLLLFRSGFAGLSVGMAVQVVIALVLTAAGNGPLQAVARGDSRTALLWCQIFLICVFVLMVMIAALLDERQRLAVMESASFDVYEWLGRLSGDLVVVAEPSGWLLYCTPTVGELLGVDAEGMRGYGWLELMHPDDVDNAWRLIHSVDQLERVQNTFRLRHSDGSWRWFVVQLRRSAGGAALERLVVGLLRDVSDQRQMEETLRNRAIELSSIAYIDALTELPNRRRLAELRAVAWRDAARDRRPLTLMVVDIDRFKAFNDHYGHLAGDQCLAAVAASMAAALRRPGDVCGRHGGEEFVVLLPKTDEDGALIVAERIRTAVVALQVAHEQSPIGVVSVSIGAATCRPTAAACSDLGQEPGADEIGDELFRAADSALYQAKSSGRNKVQFARFPLIEGSNLAEQDIRSRRGRTSDPV